MKKISMLLAILLCFALCLSACKGGEAQAPGTALDVQITAGKIEAGMTAKDVLVEVTVNHEPVACRVELTRFTGDGFYVMAEDEAVPENFYGRLDVYYSLPKGVDVDGIEVSMTCDGGEYDGTGSSGDDDAGNVVAWSHAIYGTEPEATMPQVSITAGKITAGMTAKDVSVEVTIDGEPVACRVELTRFTNDGFYVMEADEAVPENFYGRLDVYYSLPQGMDEDGVEITMTCDGGEYDGTGSSGDDENGCVVAWSHAIYGEEPEQTQPTEPSEPTTQSGTHTHSWKEDPSKNGIVGCTFDGYKTYVCSCGESKRETIPATGHDYKVTTTPATCTSSGREFSSCKRCGNGLINEFPATGHSWSGWSYENGRLHKRTCSTCGAEEEANHDVPSGTVKCTGCGQDIVN